MIKCRFHLQHSVGQLIPLPSIIPGLGLRIEFRGVSTGRRLTTGLEPGGREFDSLRATPLSCFPLMMLAAFREPLRPQAISRCAQSCAHPAAPLPQGPNLRTGVHIARRLTLSCACDPGQRPEVATRGSEPRKKGMTDVENELPHPRVFRHCLVLCPETAGFEMAALRWCRHHELTEDRIQGIVQAVPAIQDQDVIEAKQVMVQVIAQLLRSLLEGIANLDRKIEEASRARPDFFIFQSLPGAGAALAPRLLAAFGSQRDRYDSADEVLKHSGIAPVTETSGKKKWVHFRWACAKFLRQSFHEWAGHSIAQSVWARAYYQQQRERGQGHHAAVRALAFKWIRIVFRCWQDRVAYDENRYLAALARRGSPLNSTLIAATATTV